MSPSTQPDAALTEASGVRKAGLSGLKGHQGHTRKGKKLDWGPKQLCPGASAEVGAEQVTDFSQLPQAGTRPWPVWLLGQGNHHGQGVLWFALPPGGL